MAEQNIKIMQERNIEKVNQRQRITKILVKTMLYAFLILMAIIGRYPSMMMNDIGEPMTSGIDRNMMTVAMYIG